MRLTRTWSIALIVLALVVLIGLARLLVRPAAAEQSATTTITVSAASSLTDVMPPIGIAFQQANPGTQVRFTFGGSPQLVEQVIAGAPVDVLVTASEATMSKAADAGAVQSPTVIARNSMAIAMPAGNPAGISSLADLERGGVVTAICAANVPCGVATTKLLERNGIALTPASLEPDVRSVLAKVTADEVDAGIVYITDVRAAGDKVASISIPEDLNVETAYPIAVVTDSSHQEQANAFAQFVKSSSTAQRLLRDAGFLPPAASS